MMLVITVPESLNFNPGTKVPEFVGVFQAYALVMISEWTILYFQLCIRQGSE